MRYFTRELYDHMQDWMNTVPDEELEERVEESERKWREIGHRYLVYLRQHDAELSDAVKKLISYALHDALVARVHVDQRSVELQLDALHAPLIKMPVVRIIFSDVQEARGLNDLVGQTILYEELLIHDDGTFEFSALCSRSEFSIRFVHVTIS
jgi:hypothetical protein